MTPDFDMKGTPRYFDRKGNPLSLMNWAGLSQDREYKILKQEEIGEYFISTVWIGANMNILRIFGSDELHIFETMIFVEKDEKNDLNYYQERYSTEEKALEGHEKAKKLVLEKIKEKRKQDGQDL